MKTRKRIILTAISLIMFVPGVIQGKNQNVLDMSASITDNAIIYPESFEIDTRKMLEGWYMKNYTATDDSYKSKDDPNTSDETIIRRLQQMPTVIEMPYNQIVRSYIDRYTKRGRAQVSVLLGLSNYYMPIFEQALEQEGLPLELKYLPVIESGLDPNAVSRSGAAGLWQFMLGSAKGLGMDVNTLVDERRDPYISSEKAAKFLKDLYATYGDWSLSIAAYNCGPGTVNKAIRRAGGDPKSHDFWSIYNYLPAETRGYVPAFIAANYVMTYYKDHNISPVLSTKPLVTDTIAVQDRIHFDQISNVLSIPLEELQVLNPQFRQNVIPGSADHPYYLILPSQQVHAYIMSEDQIKDFEAAKYARRETVEPGENPADGILATAEGEADLEVAEEDNSEAELAEVQQAAAERSATGNGATKTVMHKVGTGETLASIAEKYGVTAGDLKNWNGLRRSAVRTGQQLKVQVAADSPMANTASANTRTANTAASTASATPKKSAAKTNTAASSSSTTQKAKKNTGTKKKESASTKSKTVKVKSGENLSVIAKKNGVTVEQLKKANNMKNDNLRAGQDLVIPGKSASTSKSKSTSSKKKSTKKKKR